MPLSHYHQLLIVVALATFSVVTVIGSVVAGRLHPAIPEWLAGVPARKRTRLLVFLRAAPTLSGILAASAIVLTFARHEPPGTTETAGLVLTVFAGFASVLLAAAVVEIVQGARRTYKCHRLVERCGQKIDVPAFPLPAFRVDTNFPVAAVSGVLRPRLILSSRVIEECTAEELAIVVRHEAAHARRRDNLVRACLLALPDLHSLFGRSRAIDKHWHRSVEEAADDEAVRSDRDAALALAGALVRVARMETSPPPAWMPPLALYDGENFEGRVRRLAAPSAQPVRRRTVPMAIYLGAAAVAGALSLAGTRPLHEVMEWAVRHLP